MTIKEYERNVAIENEVFHTRYLIDAVTESVRTSPITKGALGNYKCSRDIVVRDKEILTQCTQIQKHLHRLCDIILKDRIDASENEEES